MAEHDTKKVTEEFLKFGDAMIEKMKFHCSQKEQSIRMLRKYWYLMSLLVAETKKRVENVSSDIKYKKGEKIRPLEVELP